MTQSTLNLVFFGLSLSSSWGNGHATTYRGLLKALARRGHRISFFEREKTWYADNRDLPDPDFADLILYDSLDDLWPKHAEAIAGADAVIVGSYVPEGPGLIGRLGGMVRGPLAFYDIDTPVTLARLERDDREYLDRRQIPLFDLYLSFSGGPVLDRLETEFKAPRARPLYCSVDPEIHKPLERSQRYDLGYLGTYSPDRQPKLDRLLLEPARKSPDKAFAVAGPQYPDDLDWPSNVARIDHLPPADHAAFYAAQGLTLNVTRADMTAAGWSPSVRLFEAAACKTPILSDRWPGLDAFFEPGRDILVADTPEEAMAALDRPAAERRAMAERAYATTLENHSCDARARDLEAHLDEVLVARETLQRLAGE